MIAFCGVLKVLSSFLSVAYPTIPLFQWSITSSQSVLFLRYLFFLTLWVLERKFGEMWIPVQRFVMWIYVTAALIRSSYNCLWVYECVWERERGRGKQGWYFYVCLFEALFICMLSIVLKLRSEIFHLFFLTI